jgi:benzylsuccinate CoA-transferase BbsF subunit
MARWGLDYESVRALRPDIIYVDMPYAGVSGKYRTYGGYGLSLAALSGFAYLTAYDETEPMGTGTNYPDHVPNPYHAAVAILAALCHRCKTGRGQYVEVSQLESTLAFLGPALLWSSFTGENPPPSGKGREDALIYGVFQCRGTDRWVAISVFTDDEWRGLVKAMGSPGWSNDPRFADHESRISCRAELADRVQAWVRHFEAEEVAEVLQAHGVAAAVVENAADLLADSHLAMRNFWKRLDHPETGPAVYTGFPICFELTPGEVRSAAPSLGEHTEFICREILAMDDAEITKLKEEGALR